MHSNQNMNTLKESNLNTSPGMSPNNNVNRGGGVSTMEMDNSMMSNSSGEGKNKTPLRKDELEKIAKQLKKKLSKASITAKQSSGSNSSSAKSSPMKNYMVNKLPPSGTPSKHNLLSSSPNLLYSPTNKSPTQMRSSAAASLLSSSPLKNDGEELNDSPTKKLGSPSSKKPTMVLQSLATPEKHTGHQSLKPSPPLSNGRGGDDSNNSNNAGQTTPTLPKKQLDTSGNMPNNNVLRTPTQTKSNNYNDEEGADLLMYLATSPSPAKQFFPNTPRLHNNQGGQSESNQNGNHFHSSAPNSSQFSNHKHTSSASSSNSFIAPPPPLTPKRHINSNLSSKTPQNRLTPSVNLFSSSLNPNSSNLPSSGLALTPAGFNMNDYVNFFTPSPGGANLNNNPNSSIARNLLKTPDFNNLLNNQPGSNPNNKQNVDGKMINFDKVGLFKNPESKD